MRILAVHEGFFGLVIAQLTYDRRVRRATRVQENGGFNTFECIYKYRLC